jgi:NTE family protein
MGLGLDTAKRIVEQRHGGSLTFDTGDQGTTFHVGLPLKPAPQGCCGHTRVPTRDGNWGSLRCDTRGRATSLLTMNLAATSTIRHEPIRSHALGGSPPHTVFVLSGGASLGALQVGMLRALYEHGIEPDALVGTSVGALNAASRPQTAATARALGRVWLDLQRDDVFPLSMSALVGGVCGRRDHLVPPRGLRQLVCRHLEFGDLADAPIPLHIVAFDVLEGRELLISAGPAVEAVTAAASIPGVFPPVEMAGCRLVDGGVVNNTPISHAVELGANRVYVLRTQDPSRPVRRVPKTALDAALNALALLIESRFRADVISYSQEAEVIVLPLPDTSDVQPTNFEHSGRLISEAYGSTRTFLANRPAAKRLRLITQ